MANRIAEMVRLAGVVGAGGAGFPTQVKLDARVDLVLGNGASCEPLLSSDPYLMEFRTREVLSGLQSAMEAVGASRGLICLKKKHPRAVEALKDTIAADPQLKAMEVFILDDFYPAGDEAGPGPPSHGPGGAPGRDSPPGGGGGLKRGVFVQHPPGPGPPGR